MNGQSTGKAIVLASSIVAILAFLFAPWAWGRGNFVLCFQVGHSSGNFSRRNWLDIKGP